MKIKTYELVLDIETKHSSLQEKQSFTYGKAVVNTPSAVYKLMTEVFELHKMSDEYVYMIALNIKMKILGVFEISHGGGNSAHVDVRGVFMRAVYIGATSIILAHNHPSGEVQQSKEDVKLTKRIKEAGEIIGIPLSDHIIVGSEGYLSFHEENML